MVERLLDSEGVETEYLLDALSWMKFQWNNPYGLID
jgi:hypothetical protein